MAPWASETFSTLNSGLVVGSDSASYTSGTKVYYEIDSADADVSQNVTYEAEITDLSGLGTYHAVVELNCALDLSGLFTMEMDGNDLDDQDTNDIKFKVHSDTATIDGAFSPLAFANVTYGKYAGADASFSHDFSRHIAYKVTGGYANADIFANEEDIVADVSRAIGVAVGLLEQQWKDLAENDYVTPDDANNKLVNLAELKFKKELSSAIGEMEDAGHTGNLKSYVDGSGATYFPILHKLLGGTASSSDVSSQCVFGFSESRVDMDGDAQTESLVFHINVKVTGGQLDDNRDVSSLVTMRTYKVVLNFD